MQIGAQEREQWWRGKSKLCDWMSSLKRVSERSLGGKRWKFTKEEGVVNGV